MAVNEIEFDAKIVSLYADRLPPFGYEDKYMRTFSKSKTTTKESKRIKRGFGGGTTTGAAIEDETEKGEREAILYCRARDEDGKIDTALLGQSLEDKFLGAFRQIANMTSQYKGSDGRMIKGLSIVGMGLANVSLSVTEVGPDGEPRPFRIPMQGRNKGERFDYFECLEWVRVHVRVHAPLPAEALEEARDELENIRFGPKGRARIILED